MLFWGAQALLGPKKTWGGSLYTGAGFLKLNGYYVLHPQISLYQPNKHMDRLSFQPQLGFQIPLKYVSALEWKVGYNLPFSNQYKPSPYVGVNYKFPLTFRIDPHQFAKKVGRLF